MSDQLSPRLRTFVYCLAIGGACLPLVAWTWLVGYTPIDEISPAQARMVLAHNPTSVKLVDVRSRDYFEANHAPGAYNLTIPEVLRIRAATDLPKALQGKRLLLICHVGVSSMSCAQRLHSFGVPVTNIRGGMAAWKTSASAGSAAGAATGTASGALSLSIGWGVRWVLAPCALVLGCLALALNRVDSPQGRVGWEAALAVAIATIAVCADTSWAAGAWDGAFLVALAGQAVFCAIVADGFLRAQRPGVVVVAALAAFVIAVLCLSRPLVPIEGGADLLGSGANWRWSVLRQFFASKYLAFHVCLMALAAQLVVAFSGRLARLFVAAAVGPALLAASAAAGSALFATSAAAGSGIFATSAVAGSGIFATAPVGLLVLQHALPLGLALFACHPARAILGRHEAERDGP